MSLFKQPTIVTGNTFPYRELFRSLGGHWDAQRKAWLLPKLSMSERSSIGVLRGCDVVVAK